MTRVRKDGQPWSPMHDAWSHEHEVWVRQHAGTMTVPELAEAISSEFRVQRTPAALRIRAKHMGVSLWRKGLSMRDVERLFGVDHRPIVRWWVTPGLLRGTRWTARGPHRGWQFTERDVEVFVREHGYAYDWRVMEAGHPLRALAQVQARRDPWITFDELAEVVGVNHSNLKRWMRRGLVPHRRRHKSGNGGWIMIRAADAGDIRDRIHQAQREGIERSYAKFTAMRRASKAA